MFGLLRPHKRLVGAEDWRDYASAYCNLCASLSRRPRKRKAAGGRGGAASATRAGGRAA
jgi:hypothetical protein